MRPFPLRRPGRSFWRAHRFLALRVAYVGELGWELHVPSEYMVSVYDALKAAGADRGLRDSGYRAIDSLRLEKARRTWGHDVGPDYTPLEAGLAFAVDFSKEEFVGRDALLRQKQQGVTRRLASFTLQDEGVTLYGKETIFRDGQHVGWLTSGGFGHTIGKPLGLGYIHNAEGLDKTFLESGSYEIEVRTERVPVTLHSKPVYDPGNERILS